VLTESIVTPLAVRGSDVTLKCKGHGNPPVTFEWFKVVVLSSVFLLIVRPIRPTARSEIALFIYANRISIYLDTLLIILHSGAADTVSALQTGTLLCSESLNVIFKNTE